MTGKTPRKHSAGMSRMQFLKTMGLAAAALSSASCLSAVGGKNSATGQVPGKMTAGGLNAAGKPMRMAIAGVTYTGVWYKGPALSNAEMIDRAKKFGYAAVELDAKRPQAFPPDLDAKARRAILRKLDQTGIEMAAIGSYNNFVEPIQEYWELNVLGVREQLKLARDLNTKILRVFGSWPGITCDEEGAASYNLTRKWLTDRMASLSHEQQMDLIIKALKELAPYAEEMGVTMALQNHGPAITCYQDALDILDAVNSPYVKACIDLQNLRRSEDVRQAILDTGSRQIHMHFNGEFRRTPDGRLECHVANADFLTYIKALLEINYQGYLSYEYCFRCVQRDKDGNRISNDLAGIERIDEQVELARDFMSQTVADARAALAKEAVASA